jgi:hypothetical protein
MYWFEKVPSRVRVHVLLLSLLDSTLSGDCSDEDVGDGGDKDVGGDVGLDSVVMDDTDLSMGNSGG